MSSRPDPGSYERSLEIIAAVNAALPEASMRPARAKDFRRMRDLLATRQIHLAVMAAPLFDDLRAGRGAFDGMAPVDGKIVYRIDDMLILAHPDFHPRFVWDVTMALQRGGYSAQATRNDLDGEDENDLLHPGARAALVGGARPTHDESDDDASTSASAASGGRSGGR